MIKKCKICGKEFETSTNGCYCQGPHFKICVICGKEFEINTSQITKLTCSNSCRIQYIRNKSNSRSLISNSSDNPNKIKPGKYLRTCEICGESFRTGSKVRRLCYKPHTRKCCICGNEFSLGVYASETLTCSRKCAGELRTQRNIEKYGVRSTLQLESTKSKIKQTCLDRYGVENPASADVVKERIKKTNLDRFGVEWAIQSPEVRQKSQQTCMERYGVKYGCISNQAKLKTKQTNLERRGVEHVFQDPEFRENARRSCLERYGTEYYLQSQEFKAKAKATWISNYGVDNPLKCSEIQRRIEATSMDRYGTRRPQQFDEIKEKIRQTNIENKANTILDENARNEYLEFKRNPKKYLESYISSNPNTTPSALSSRLGFKDTTIILDYLHKYEMDEITANISSIESALIEFIYSLDDSIDVIVHDRTIISPQEIDLYLPQYKLGIECNPTSTHNCTISLGQIFGDETSKPISYNYHKQKSLACLNQGIFLFHIFGYEWKNRQYVLKSMLRNLLNKTPYRYYSRNLKIQEVNSKEADTFLNCNHRQGTSKSKINLGLYTHENELVSLMTFGLTRMCIGYQKSDNDTVWELVRFCNKLNTSVVGGASKLFKYFLKNYSWTKIISFSDIAHTKGGLYEKLGFKQIHISDPGYCWVNLNTDLYLNRVTCQKRNLPKLFDEPDLDIKNQTEKQIMVSHGFVQVFDSGVVRWEYTI